MVISKYTPSICEHRGPTGRRSRRRACYVPGAPAEAQGLCASCMGESMIRHALEAQAQRLANKLAGFIAIGLGMEQLPQSIHIGITKRSKELFLEMATFAKRHRGRNAKQHRQDSPLES